MKVKKLVLKDDIKPIKKSFNLYFSGANNNY